MNDLKIFRTENGFLVEAIDHLRNVHKQWTFESHVSLTDFLRDWAIDHERMAEETSRQQQEKEYGKR